MSDDEMHIAIAKRIYGWELVTEEEHGIYHEIWVKEGNEMAIFKDDFKPSRKSEQALKLIEYFLDLEYSLEIKKRHRGAWSVTLNGVEGRDPFSLSRAICKAALECYP